MSSAHAAAFYDMDGTLVRTNLVHSYLFTTFNDPSLIQAVRKTVFGLAKIPAFMVVDRYDRVNFNEMLFKGYKGAFRDRLLEFADEHFEKVLKPNIFPGAYELIETGHRKGLRQVIVSGSLDIMVAPLAKHLGIDDIITNKLEFRDDVATGRLLPPLLVGANKVRLMQEYAQKWDVDLTKSYGFSDSFSDYPMLSVVGRPAAVNPDRKLRRSARSFNWPVLDLS
jgi:HAD superfamily hydrolase (TIGR01490 family)